jgi:RNA polymerase sigma factor (sigma-70 family)
MKLSNQEFVLCVSDAMNEGNRKSQQAYSNLYKMLYSFTKNEIRKQVFNCKGEDLESLNQIIIAHILSYNVLVKFDATQAAEPWLKTIIKNKCLDEYKRNRNNDKLLSIDKYFNAVDEDGYTSFEPADDILLADDVLQREAKKVFIRRKIEESLFGEQKRVLELFYLQQKNQKEIMLELNITKTKVGVLLNRAIDKLRKSIDLRNANAWLVL